MLPQVKICTMTMKEDKNGRHYLIGQLGDMRWLAFHTGENAIGDAQFSLVVSPMPESKAEVEQEDSAGLKKFLNNAERVT